MTAKTNESADNIADEDIDTIVANITAAPITKTEEAAADDYMKLFESLERLNEQMDATINAIDNAPDQDARLALVIKYLRETKKYRAEQYNLLVQMNNFFAPKD